MRTVTCISAIALLGLGLSYGFGDGKTQAGSTDKVERGSSEKQLLAMATPKAPPAGNPLMDARNPFIKEGNVDVYQAGRWDSSDNYVSCKASINGDDSGTIASSVLYFRFDPPTTGTYFVKTRFSGHQKTCRVNGPWGTASGFTANMGDDGVVITSFTTRSGNPIEFTMVFTTAPGEGISAVWRGTEFLKFAP